MDSRLGVSCGRFGTYLDFIIIVKILFFVVTVLGFHIRQDEGEMSVAVSITVNGSLNGCRSKQVKFPISADKEVYVLSLRYQVMQELV
ncbi:MAG: hypothetical protein IJ555_14455, partial [Ruminococcus sp.]|nr:hypothetical protein [Ruminococcus sp.]